MLTRSTTLRSRDSGQRQAFTDGRVGLPGQQRPSERFRATPRRLADKPAASLHSPATEKAPQGSGAKVIQRGLAAGTRQTRRMNSTVGCTARGEPARKSPAEAGLVGSIMDCRNAGPSVLRRRHSGRLRHRSWPALPRFGHGMEMRLGSGQAAAVWRSTGAIMGNVVNDFLLFSCMALFVTGIVLAAASLLI